MFAKIWCKFILALFIQLWPGLAPLDASTRALNRTDSSVFPTETVL